MSHPRAVARPGRAGTAGRRPAPAAARLPARRAAPELAAGGVFERVCQSRRLSTDRVPVRAACHDGRRIIASRRPPRRAHADIGVDRVTGAAPRARDGSERRAHAARCRARRAGGTAGGIDGSRSRGDRPRRRAGRAISSPASMAIDDKDTERTSPSRRSSAPTIRAGSPTRGSRSSRSTAEEDLPGGPRERSASPASSPSRAASTARCTASAWTMRQYAGYASAKESNERYNYLLEHGSTGLSMAFDLPTQLGLDSDDPRCLGEVGRTGVAIDTIDDMRTAFDGIPLDEVSTSMTINAPAACCCCSTSSSARSRASTPSSSAARPERHPQGVHRPRELHLPARAADAADHRPVRLLQGERPEVEHGLDLRLPLPREGLLGGPGGRLHARQRHRLRAGRARRRPGGRRVRARAWRSSSTATTTSSRRSRSSAPPGGCGRTS